MFIPVKNQYDLKHNVELTGSTFFDRKTMKFHGDTMGNYAVSKKTVKIKAHAGLVECYELKRKRPVVSGGFKYQDSAYFNMLTFERVFKHD